MGFDPVSQIEDSIQYSFRDGAAYKNNLFLNSTPIVFELCIYHDGFRHSKSTWK